MVGIPVLAQRLVQIQATIISKCLPDIVRKVNEKLNASVSELKKMRPNFSSASEAIAAFMQIIGLSKESLRKIRLRGEFDEYPDDKFRHATARLVEMLNDYSEELQKSSENNNENNFLVEEIRLLEEGKVIGLPNFIPRAAFKTLLQKKVNQISSIPISFVSKLWDYIETVVINVLMQHSENYPQLQSSTRMAAQNLIAKMKKKFGGRVNEIIEMERLTDYTCDPEYMASWNKLMNSYNLFSETMNDCSEPTEINIEGFRVVEVSHLRSSPTLTIGQAYNLKMRIIAYWNIVLKRLVDFMALHLEWSVEKFVSQEMEVEIVNELVGGEGWGGIERLLKESPCIAAKRERLHKSIGLLRELKEVLVKVMDRISMDNH